MKEKYGLIIGKEYFSNNYGIYTIINFSYHEEYKYNKTFALIKFKNTGYICEVPLIFARNGNVKDHLANHTTPIDLMCIDINDRQNRLLSIIKPVWRSMIKRCEDKNANNHERYGGKGIKICDTWKDFYTFYNDLPYLFQYEKWARWPTLYNIDKDYLAFKNNIPIEQRYYSKETCIFLHYMDNTNLRSIEYRNNNARNTLTSKYFGVDSRIINGNKLYRPRVYAGGKEHYFGWFDNEEIAAAVYNYHYLRFHQMMPRFELVPLLNNVPPISPKDIIKYNVKPKLLCIKY